MLESITKQTATNPKMVVIWLHGLGADGHDFESVVPQFAIPDLPIKFVFPHAPIQPVTINGGMKMRSWYDIKMLDIGKQADEAGIRQSEKLVLELIEHQIGLGFKSEQIVLAGFSQGGAIALHTSTRMNKKLAGVVALSCYLPMPEKLESEKSTANQNTPFFMGHGSFDPVVPFQLGLESKQHLEKQSFQVQWHEYPLQHGVSMDELQDIKLFLSALKLP
ncbi:MAG: alpha/beta hydrolase [Proteobacteria bacterium]|nr:alpha/beta hydrolase [Pseudomonadota bacterium]